MTNYNHKMKSFVEACGIAEERDSFIKEFAKNLTVQLSKAKCNSEEVEVFERELINNQNLKSNEKALIVVVLSNALHKNAVESTLKNLAESMAQDLFSSMKGKKREPIGFGPMGTESSGNC